jgi:hypothetical protein
MRLPLLLVGTVLLLNGCIIFQQEDRGAEIPGLDRKKRIRLEERALSGDARSAEKLASYYYLADDNARCLKWLEVAENRAGANELKRCPSGAGES